MGKQLIKNMLLVQTCLYNYFINVFIYKLE